MDLVVFGHVFLGEDGLPAVDKRISYFYAYCVPDHKSELQRVLFTNNDCVTFSSFCQRRCRCSSCQPNLNFDTKSLEASSSISICKTSSWCTLTVKWNEAAWQYRSKTLARVLWFFVKWRAHLICFHFSEYCFWERGHKNPSQNLSELSVLWEVNQISTNINIATPSGLAQRIDKIAWRESRKHTL
jgi:hypothetical protein